MDSKYFRLYKLFVRCLEDLSIKEKIPYSAFYKACQPTMYRNLPSQIKDNYKEFLKEHFTDSDNNEDLSELLEYYTDHIIGGLNLKNMVYKEERSIG